MEAICESLGDWSFQTYQEEAVGCVDRTRVLHPKSQVLGNFLQFCLFNPLLCCGTQDLCVLGRCSMTELFQPYPHPTPAPLHLRLCGIFLCMCSCVYTCVHTQMLEVTLGIFSTPLCHFLPFLLVTCFGF